MATTMTTDKRKAHENSKLVQKGEARLERHAGRGYRGVAKKSGCGGKGTWGSALDDWERTGDEWDEEQDYDESEEQPVSDATLEKAAKKKKLVAWTTEMASSLRRGRRANKPSAHANKKRKTAPLVPHTNMVLSAEQQRVDFGAGYEPAASMGETYDLVTTRSFHDEVQAIVELLAGPSTTLSSDMAKLEMKKMMSKKMMKHNSCSFRPAQQNRNGVRYQQPRGICH